MLVFARPSLLCLPIILYSIKHVHCYKPVIFMHGILSNGGKAKDIFQWINEVHPGTETFIVKMFENDSSLFNLNRQAKKIGAWMTDLMKKYPSGINLICFSQGGQVCRGIVERQDHNVHTFISLSSPQAGQFGMTGYISKLFPHWVLDNIYKIMYTPFGQDFSVSDYWNDPHHQDEYRNHSSYLAFLNNDRTHKESQKYKTNFTKLKKLVLIGGPDDGVIKPWQSSQFGFFDEEMNVKNMSSTKWFKEDMFGLKTLYKRGDLVTCTFSRIHHTSWPHVKPVFDKCILPYLT